jgi:hypothetical protein
MFSRMRPTMMTCKSCGKEISRKAFTCPHCGHVYSSYWLNVKRAQWGCAWIMIAIIAGLFILFVMSAPPP